MFVCFSLYLSLSHTHTHIHATKSVCARVSLCFIRGAFAALFNCPEVNAKPNCELPRSVVGVVRTLRIVEEGEELLVGYSGGSRSIRKMNACTCE